MKLYYNESWSIVFRENEDDVFIWMIPFSWFPWNFFWKVFWRNVSSKYFKSYSVRVLSSKFYSRVKTKHSLCLFTTRHFLETLFKFDLLSSFSFTFHKTQYQDFSKWIFVGFATTKMLDFAEKLNPFFRGSARWKDAKCVDFWHMNKILMIFVELVRIPMIMGFDESLEEIFIRFQPKSFCRLLKILCEYFVTFKNNGSYSKVSRKILASL